ncbi:MAG: hypothetical protein JW829_08150 [Pirellulales bacterium]|nr:hypothetical protein [Pirellulales bacterium]
MSWSEVDRRNFAPRAQSARFENDARPLSSGKKEPHKFAMPENRPGVGFHDDPIRRSHQAAHRRPRKFTWLLLVALSMGGCQGVSNLETSDSKASDDSVARTQAELGPVRVSVEVEPAKAKLSDEPVLTLTMDYERGVTIHKPPFGEAFGDFIIRDFREPLARSVGNREILEQVYTLEPTRTGKIHIDPISVSFSDTRPDGDHQEHTIETEGLVVEVDSVVPTDMPSLADLRPLKEPVPVPQLGRNYLVWFVLAGGFVLAASLLFWYIRKKLRKREDEIPLTPEELAYLELNRIIRANLAEEDVKQFYVELTGVVRRYIERTKGIRAPEQTTEEFLREISGQATFQPDENRRLRAFLESADLVKFAAFEPRKDDIEESFHRAKQFIGLETDAMAA